jgi:hypothetical protein
LLGRSRRDVTRKVIHRLQAPRYAVARRKRRKSCLGNGAKPTVGSEMSAGRSLPFFFKPGMSDLASVAELNKVVSNEAKILRYGVWA